jgi:hypothetical protein
MSQFFGLGEFEPKRGKASEADGCRSRGEGGRGRRQKCVRHVLTFLVLKGTVLAAASVLRTRYLHPAGKYGPGAAANPLRRWGGGLLG